ncbi:spondin-2-like isoform X2 [Leptidea sinapis]|uniref:spondin-2-like isoform X2 n=1 Tax=Leptidea sinapis TaxID=189913 RepID=UPI0021232876|nr:spondin-2-like isoform X2 [Leptidea sinapis]
MHNNTRYKSFVVLNTLIILVSVINTATGQLGRCDQTPTQADVTTPSENNGIYRMSISTKGNDTNIYRPDQTYVLKLTSNNPTRPFRWFMITVEDPDVDNSPQFDHKSVDVGSLKTIDTNRQARYSERCYNSVENTDNSDKYKVEIHWVSPKQNDRKQTVRLRAMVAENSEVWYTGENLTIILEKDNRKPLDSPPYSPTDTCNLCSEARYEVIFNGRWSRMTHPRYYPSRPDDNGYSYMVGASHSYDYILWQPGDKASPGLQKLAEEADISVVEREIINAMSLHNGTRTLIRGKRHYHPDMHAPSHAVFRVDRIHHLFSVLVGMKPSPDWFLGASRFELCTDIGWLEYSEIPLYPWDAGTMDGVSYESPTSMTQPVDTVDRVAVGSFNQESPFYQMNLNELKPFAILQVRRLDVYPLNGVECSNDKGTDEAVINDEGISSYIDEEPRVLSSRQNTEECVMSDWSEWSECKPDSGNCGLGTQIRSRRTQRKLNYEGYLVQTNEQIPIENCRTNENDALVQSQQCFVNC